MSLLPGVFVLVSIAVGLAILPVFILRRSLGLLLVELCRNERRARFWAIYTSVILVLSTLTGMLLFPPARDSSLWASYPTLHELLPTFRAGVIGLLAALGGLACVLFLSIAANGDGKTGKA